MQPGFPAPSQVVAYIGKALHANLSYLNWYSDGKTPLPVGKKADQFGLPVPSELHVEDSSWLSVSLQERASVVLGRSWEIGEGIPSVGSYRAF
jgi:hypothetical protein